MFRPIAVAAMAVAAVSVASAEYVKLSTVEECNRAVAELDKQANASGRPAKEVEQARQAIASLRQACDSGDLTIASQHATEARQSLVQEN